MISYSVAIRTLGTSGQLLQRELESLQQQTLKPRKVVIYIAEGYDIPEFRVADEEYVSVKKGMVAQQALDYNEIDTDLILKLDDDVEFTSETDAEDMVNALISEGSDCIVADTFCNHKMSVASKFKAILSSLVFPRFNQKWAFKVHSNGSFSYINNPKQNLYPSQTGAGPCSLWKKTALTGIDLKSELWLDSLGFSYGDDQIIFQKLVKNGGKLVALFHTGIVHNDGRSSSGKYHENINKFRTRAKGQFLVWHRSVLSGKMKLGDRVACCLSFVLKILWMLPIHCMVALQYRSARIPYLFVRGTLDGINFVHSKQYKSLSPFILK